MRFSDLYTLNRDPVTLPPVPLPHSSPLSRRLLVGLWILALPALLAGLGTPVTQRTQEARVLETAREMLASHDWHQWLIPRLNDKVRLEKPPFAYWMAAGSFKLFGVNEFAGRLPFAISGWLLIGLVYRFGKRLINEQFGLFSAAMLLTSSMFFSHFRLAETDAPAALFLTTAIYWLYRGAGETKTRRSYAFFQLGGAAIGLAALPKGPQAAFAILFFAAWIIVEKNWAALARFLLSGALLTALVIGGSWYLYVAVTSPNALVIWKEIKVVTRGGDHIAHFFVYFPWIFRATMPWTGLVVLGCTGSILPNLLGRYGWRRDPAIRVLMLWAGAILVPLLCAGNKQNHYLVPMTPPLAMLGAYAVCRGLSRQAQFADQEGEAASGESDRAPDPDAIGHPAAVRWVIGITFAISLLAPAAVFAVGRFLHRPVQSTELALILVMIAALFAAVAIARRHGLLAGVACYTVGIAMVFAITYGRWLPSLNLVHHRQVAADLRNDFGDGPYAFYGKNFSLPLIWNLRQTIPLLETADALKNTLDQVPKTVIIIQAKNDREAPVIPDRLEKIADYETGDEGAVFSIYILKE